MKKKRKIEIKEMFDRYYGEHAQLAFCDTIYYKTEMKQKYW